MSQECNFICSYIKIGGHEFNTVEACAQYFCIPVAYVEHMLDSDKYPGCQRWDVVETVSYYQTMSIMKSTDTCGSHVEQLPVDPNSKP